MTVHGLRGYAAGEAVLGDYGLGLALKRTTGDIVFSHGGSNEGFRCFAVNGRTGS